ncbi:hypothetical protein CJ209_01115 [Fusobacterium nucleatum]|uniref:Uncharacterized protein n=1 Tax=Fusobacterium nucleatum TaxID=851 RepID=A0A2N6TNP9_FUSNU|nr:hypothetical protein CJ209_01115 [Fusobacterium nucleatum]
MLNSLRSNTARFARLILFNFYPKIWNVIHLFFVQFKITVMFIIVERVFIELETLMAIKQLKYVKRNFI